MTKKLMSIVLAILMVASLFAICAVASEPVAVSISNGTADDDGYCTLDIELQLPEAVAEIGTETLEMTMVYDQGLEPVSQSKKKPNDRDKCVATGEITQGGMLEVNTNTEQTQIKNGIKLAYIKTSPITESGVWFTIKFKVTDMSIAKKYNIAITRAAGIDSNYKALTYVTTGGSVTVPAVMSSISVKSLPTKTVYDINESFDPTGLVVSANYNDGTSEDVTDYTLSGFDSSTVGTKTITVAYEGFETTFDVEVIAKLNKIEVKTLPDKTLYTIGDQLDATGLVLTGTYSDSSTKDISAGYTLSGFDSATVGVKTVTVTYEGLKTTFDVTVEARLTGISVKTPPTKTTYFIGDSLDTTGLEIAAAYNDGTTKLLESTEYTVSGADFTTTGTKTITVSYKGFETSFNVTVNELALVGITKKSDPDKTTYWLGEPLDTTGLVLEATYSDGSKQDITGGYTCDGYNPAVEGEQTVTVWYGNFSAQFNVTVVKPIAIELEIAKEPDKVIYLVGEELDTTGMVLKVYYNDGSDREVAEGYTTTGFESATAGNKTVTVNYEGLTVDFIVVVKNPKPIPFYGDADLSGKVNTTDAMLTMQAASKKVGFNEQQFVNADVDGNETINTTDAMLILQYAAGKIKKFPVESK